MSIAAVLAILSLINGLLSVAKDAPTVIDEAKSLLAKIEPHVDAVGVTARAQFDDLTAQVKQL